MHMQITYFFYMSGHMWTSTSDHNPLFHKTQFCPAHTHEYASRTRVTRQINRYKQKNLIDALVACNG